jgi:hypothetical protein
MLRCQGNPCRVEILKEKWSGQEEEKSFNLFKFSKMSYVAKHFIKQSERVFQIFFL